MSMPVLPDGRLKVTFVDKLLVHSAVRLARYLSKKSPKRIRTILGKLAKGTRPATHEQARRVHEKVLTVSAYCCGGEACVPRSIAVALVCRIRGTWPEWCVGVLTAPPFAAHAWVEADGEMVNEIIEPEFYRKLFSVPAS
jgi:hypothetical protein